MPSPGKRPTDVSDQRCGHKEVNTILSYVLKEEFVSVITGIIKIKNNCEDLVTGCGLSVVSSSRRTE